MTSTATMERTGIGMPGVNFPGFGVTGFPQTTNFGTTPFSTPGVNFFSVPRCTFKVERCDGGFKVFCNCEDMTACSVVQNLCSAMAGGLCSCNVTFNGVTVCTYNFTMGLCRWETIDKGVCFYCTSGDPKCTATLQSWCDCMTSLFNAGCHCCFCVNNTPVCYGCFETGMATKTPSSKK